MKVERFATAGELLARAGRFLEVREAEHNLLHGILGRLRNAPEPTGHTPYLRLISGADRSVLVVALRTPPWGLVLSEVDDPSAIEPLAADVRSVYHDLPAALGPRIGVAAFAQRWRELTGAPGRRVMEQRIYRCSELDPPSGVSGAGRDYEDRDRGLVTTWMKAFTDEALHEGAPDTDPEEWLDRRLGDPAGRIVIWEDRGRPVSFASGGNETPNGVRVGPVYTPPASRGRGYASAVTAAVTDRYLGEGRRFCFLFTDLANPTSNAIYQRIGYEPVTDVDQWAFD